MSLLVLIPARGGSKGVPRKNVRLLAGKPLIAWTIEAARQARGVDRIVVSTEDEEIAQVAREYGAETPFMRPEALAQDTTPGMDVVFHALDCLPTHDDILLLQPTSPLRTVEDIEAIILQRGEQNAPAAVSVSEVGHPPEWMYRLDVNKRMRPLLNSLPPTRRQDAVPVYALNGALYLARVSWLLEKRSFVSGQTLGYVIPPERSADIDTPLDWRWVEFLLKEKLRG
jgi:CMP-N,N'-diacetyllegionaminic acid synthase